MLPWAQTHFASFRISHTKVHKSYSVRYLYWTLVCERCAGWLDLSMDTHQDTCLKEVGLRGQRFVLGGLLFIRNLNDICVGDYQI